MRVVILLGLLLCLPVLGQPLTPREALAEVLTHHPEVKAARLRVEAARSAASGAGAQPNPELRLAGELGDANTDANYIQQRLEIGGQTGLRGQVADLDVEQAQSELAIEERKLSTRLAGAYYDLWEAARLTEVAVTGHQSATRLETITRRRLELGEVSESQLLRVQLETARAEAQLAQAEAREQVARAELNTLLQRLPDDPMALPTSAEALPQAPALALPEPVWEDLVARAQTRPELAAARRQASRARLEADLTGRQRVPDLELTAYRSRLTGAAENGVRLALVMPLFDWGRIGAAEAQKEKEAEALEQLVLSRDQEIQQQVRSAYARYEAARKRREVLRSQVERSHHLAALAAQGFEVGLLGLLDVLDAQRVDRETFQDYIAAEADFQRLRLQLHWISGGSPLPDTPLETKDDSP